VLSAADLLDAGELAARHEAPGHQGVAERAAADRTWTFGHVIVDEAQELSQMAWRLLARRSPRQVDDNRRRYRADRRPGRDHVLGTDPRNRWLATGGAWPGLTVNYRTPAEIMDGHRGSPGRDRPRAGPAAVRARDRRAALADGHHPATRSPATLAEVTAQEAASAGRLAVIVPDARVQELGKPPPASRPTCRSGRTPT